MIIKIQLLAVIAVLATLSVTASAQTMSQDELSARLMRREVQRAPLSIPGRDVVQVETEIPPLRSDRFVAAHRTAAALALHLEKRVRGPSR